VSALDDRRTLPTPDRDSAPYWQGLADGHFLLQRCRYCGHWTWPARPICSQCHSDELEWTESLGAGAIYSWVVTYQAYAPDMAELAPYPIALVRLDEQSDLLVPGRYVGEAETAQGLRVRAQFERVREDLGLLLWGDD
jgi:uncharacterized OB-fold protein